MPIRILIADDHAVVRQGFKMFLGLDEEFEITGEPTNSNCGPMSLATEGLVAALEKQFAALRAPRHLGRRPPLPRT